ncbi:hypothetical protein E0K83_04025 [Gramella sp. BOM4]|nr:hypothetical protein [Christiangramia bathymodioli]
MAKFKFEINTPFRGEDKEARIKELASRELAKEIYPKLHFNQMESNLVSNNMTMMDFSNFHAECSIHVFDPKEMSEIIGSLRRVKSLLYGTNNREIMPLLDSVLHKLRS